MSGYFNFIFRNLTIAFFAFNILHGSAIGQTQPSWAFAATSIDDQKESNSQLGCIATGKDGAIFMSGLIRGEADFDPGTTTCIQSSANEETSTFCYVAKYSAKGDLIWFTHTDGQLISKMIVVNDTLRFLAVLKYRGPYHDAQMTAGTIDLNTGEVIRSIDLMGASGPSSYTGTKQVDLYSDGSFCVVGQGFSPFEIKGNSGIATRISGTGSSSSFSFIAMYDSNFELSWHAILNTGDKAVYPSCRINEQGEPILFFSLETSIEVFAKTNFVITPKNPDNISPCFISFSKQGDIKWYNLLDVSKSDGAARIFDVATDATGYIYITGTVYLGKMDLDPGEAKVVLTATDSYRDIMFLAKYHSTGKLVWGRSTYGGENLSKIESLEVGDNGKLYYTGKLWGNTDLSFSNTYDALSNDNKHSDIFVAMCDTSGRFIKAIKTSGNVAQEDPQIAISDLGNVIVGFKGRSRVDISPGDPYLLASYRATNSTYSAIVVYTSDLTFPTSQPPITKSICSSKDLIEPASTNQNGINAGGKYIQPASPPANSKPVQLQSFSTYGVTAANYHSYTGPNSAIVYQLLDAVYQGNYSSTPIIYCSTCCQRDGFVAMAVNYAWATVVYASGNNGNPMSMTPQQAAQKMMDELAKADQLCGPGVIIETCPCLTFSIWPCPQ